MTFSETVKQVRIESNLTQKAFANALGVSFSTVNRWENGVQTPSKMAKKIMLEFYKTREFDFICEESNCMVKRKDV